MNKANVCLPKLYFDFNDCLYLSYIKPYRKAKVYA